MVALSCLSALFPTSLTCRSRYYAASPPPPRHLNVLFVMTEHTHNLQACECLREKDDVHRIVLEFAEDALDAGYVSLPLPRVHFTTRFTFQDAAPPLSLYIFIGDMLTPR